MSESKEVVAKAKRPFALDNGREDFPMDERAAETG